MADDQIKLSIQAILDDKEFQAGIKRMTAGFKTAKSSSDGFFSIIKKNFMGMVSGAGLAIAATAAVAKVIIDSGKAYIEAEQSAVKLSNAMKANNQYTKEGFDQLKSFSTQMMMSTNIEKTQSQALLTTALNMGLAKDQAMQATKGAIGLNAALGVDMERALRASVATLQGHTEQLTRSLPELRNFKTDAEKVAFATDIMRKGFKQAEDNTMTFGGQLKFLGNVSKEMEVTLGEGIAKGIQPAISRMQEFLKSAEGMKEMGDISRALAVTFVVLETVVVTAVKIMIDSITADVNIIRDAGKVFDDVFHKRWGDILKDSQRVGKNYVTAAKKDFNDLKTGVIDAMAGINSIMSKQPETKKPGNVEITGGATAGGATAGGEGGGGDDALEQQKKDHEKYLAYLKGNVQSQIEIENGKYQALLKIAKEQNLDMEALKIQHEENMLKISAGYAKQTVSGVANMLKDTGTLFAGKSKEQFEANKAASIASATVATYESAVKAYDSMVGIPIVGPELGVAAAALAVAAGLGNIKQIASTNYSGKAAKGALINNPSMVLAGEAGPEMILPANLTKMFSAMATQGVSTPSPSGFAGRQTINNQRSEQTTNQHNDIHVAGMTIDDFMNYSRRLGSNPFSR